jgi:hypothetical protein
VKNISIMLNYRTKKKNKLNIYKSVRESIHLNNSIGITIDLPKNSISDDNMNMILQLAEFNLTTHLHTQNLGKKGKLVVKWWEN